VAATLTNQLARGWITSVGRGVATASLSNCPASELHHGISANSRHRPLRSAADIALWRIDKHESTNRGRSIGGAMAQRVEMDPLKRSLLDTRLTWKCHTATCGRQRGHTRLCVSCRTHSDATSQESRFLGPRRTWEEHVWNIRLTSFVVLS